MTNEKSAPVVAINLKDMETIGTIAEIAVRKVFAEHGFHPGGTAASLVHQVVEGQSTQARIASQQQAVQNLISTAKRLAQSAAPQYKALCDATLDACDAAQRAFKD